MAPRHALLSPALVGAVLAPALLFSFTSATPLAAAAPVTNVANGGFERGTTHWSAPGSKVKLSSTTSSWSGKRALKATATKRTPLRIRSERPVRPGTADKLRWSIRVKPSTARKVTLVVVERTASGAKKKHRTSTWAPARTWTKVNVTTKQRGTSSTFRQVLRTKGLKRGHAVAVDAAKVKQVRSNGNQSTQDKRTGTLSNGCSHSSRGLPECGGYLGMAYGSNSDPATLESEMDAQMGIRRTYYRADQVAGAVRTAKADLAKGRLPWVSFKFPHNWDQMNAGKGDAWARVVGQAVRRARRPGLAGLPPRAGERWQHPDLAQGAGAARDDRPQPGRQHRLHRGAHRVARVLRDR
ncbi:hypothetical protein [Nocardioides alcanivorans]|uniref:hypothetical protein n=1 Tax=Nocardioides alcanivorans TaxID=2897352 RepID=UPI001F33B7A5|nr:hypothetical protein [Nocardioides alcanivorans]